MDSKEKTAGILNLLSGHNPIGACSKTQERKASGDTFQIVTSLKKLQRVDPELKRGSQRRLEADGGGFSGRKNFESYTKTAIRKCGI